MWRRPPRTARDLGVPFDGEPGPLNGITDVAGVEVGHATLISGNGKLVVGQGPVRTGVTAVLPRGRGSSDPVFAATFALNGNGEMTGTAWIEEGGFLEGPVMFTNTHSVGVVRDAVIAWRLAHGGAVEEGSVGGGTGMICFEFKGGIGTSSRRLPAKLGGFTIGVIVQCNTGLRRQLRIAGVPVGKAISEGAYRDRELGSILITVATDAPLLPHQLKRLARRAALGLARLGSVAMNGSGDLFLAFSTANPNAASPRTVAKLSMVPNDGLDSIFEATVQATEEAIVNAMVASPTMRGIDDRTILGLPHQRLQDVLRHAGVSTPR